jgi:hypothetical protein
VTRFKEIEGIEKKRFFDSIKMWRQNDKEGGV